MIKRLDFNNCETITEQCEVITEKISEIIEVVNSLTEVTMLKNRIAVLETNNNVAKTSCGGRNVTSNAMFSTPTPWEPFREEAITTITQSKDGLTVTVGTKERNSSMKMTGGQTELKVTSSNIKVRIGDLNATKANITSLECRDLKY